MVNDIPTGVPHSCSIRLSSRCFEYEQARWPHRDPSSIRWVRAAGHRRNASDAGPVLHDEYLDKRQSMAVLRYECKHRAKYHGGILAEQTDKRSVEHKSGDLVRNPLVRHSQRTI